VARRCGMVREYAWRAPPPWPRSVSQESVAFNMYMYVRVLVCVAGAVQRASNAGGGSRPEPEGLWQLGLALGRSVND
jgi:hypothetical protein